MVCADSDRGDQQRSHGGVTDQGELLSGAVPHTDQQALQVRSLIHVLSLLVLKQCRNAPIQNTRYSKSESVHS